MQKIKHYLRHENKENKQNYIVRYEDVKQQKTTKKLFSFMSNLQTYYYIWHHRYHVIAIKQKIMERGGQVGNS